MLGNRRLEGRGIVGLAVAGRAQRSDVDPGRGSGRAGMSDSTGAGRVVASWASTVVLICRVASGPPRCKPWENCRTT